MTFTIEGTASVCAHNVRWNYEVELDEQPDDLYERLESAAEDRAKEMINEGYNQGELNCLYVREDTDMEIRGWWSID